jgi:nucleoside transporter
MAQQTLRWTEYIEIAALFFLHAMAMGAWFVPLGPVLDAHGYSAIKPYAFATSAVAAFISPLFFGAMADRHAGPSRVLRWLSFATAVAMASAGAGIKQGLSPILILGLIQLHALSSSPTWGLSTAIVLSRLTDSKRQFGPIRAVATLGWIAGCLAVSALRADSSTLSCFLGAGVWVVVGLFTLKLPTDAPAGPPGHSTFRQRLGLDALALLYQRNHRVVFITAALFAIPMAAFYPFAPTHLRSLGMERTAAWMTLGQITEVAAMIGLAGVLQRCPFKWTLAAGLSFGVIRYALCAMNGTGWMLAGVSLHGFAYTLFFITGQIYLDQRIDSMWRARAQALFSVMMSGFGNLFGYLGTGWWFHYTTSGSATNWRLFWGGLAVLVAGVLVYFVTSYRRAKEEH